MSSILVSGIVTLVHRTSERRFTHIYAWEPIALLTLVLCNERMKNQLAAIKMQLQFVVVRDVGKRSDVISASGMTPVTKFMCAGVGTNMQRAV